MEKIRRFNENQNQKIVGYQLMIWVGEGWRIENNKSYEYPTHVKLTVESAIKYALENKVKVWVELVARNDEGDSVERQTIFTINGSSLEKAQKKIDKYENGSTIYG